MSHSHEAMSNISIFGMTRLEITEVQEGVVRTGYKVSLLKTMLMIMMIKIHVYMHSPTHQIINFFFKIVFCILCKENIRA